MASSAENLWFRRFRSSAGSRVRLVCLPHAGGSASFFRDWPERLPASVDVLTVQYPGRGDRIDDTCVDDLHLLSDDITAALSGLTDLPIVLFGHSLGGAIAFEIAVRLANRGHQPRALVVSGRAAPCYDASGTVHLRDDDGIWQEITRLGGTVEEITRSEEWRSLLTPALRADFRASETYRPTPVTMQCPVLALIGTDDPDVDEQHARDWRAYCTGEFRLRSFVGGHFYLTDHVDAVAAEIMRLSGDVVATPWPWTP